MKFLVQRNEPVQQVVAHPATLALLAAVLPKTETRPGPHSADGLGLLAGLPCVPDRTMPAGLLHLRPFPARTEPPTSS